MLISFFLTGCAGGNTLKIPDNTPALANPVPSVPVDQYNLLSEGVLEVGKGQTVTQTFTASKTMFLSGIEIAVERCQASVTDVLTLEFGRGQIPVGIVSITGAGLPGTGRCEAVPARLRLSTSGPGYFDLRSVYYQMISGQTYYFKLTASPEHGFIVGFSSNAYTGGTALINDEPSTFDLAFKIVVSSSEF
jgi:hypothetical protein